MAERLKMVVGAHLVLRRRDEVLLARRCNTGFADGLYNCPCGHLDPDEDVIEAVIREAKEEIGVSIKKKDLRLVGVNHWRRKKQAINFFFECRVWKGEPKNCEEDKCDDVRWFPLSKLPSKTLKQTKAMLKEYKKSPKAPFFIESED